MSAIYKRELKSYFHSMIGYVFIAFLIAFTGVYFMAYNLNYGYPYFSYVLSGVLIVFVIAIPVLTMRSFAEERKSRTDQMLLTAQPVSGRYRKISCNGNNSGNSMCSISDFPTDH